MCVCMRDELSCMCVCMGDELSCMCVCMGDELSFMCVCMGDELSCMCMQPRDPRGLATGLHHACMHVWLVLCQVHAFLFTCMRMHTCKIACVCRPY